MLTYRLALAACALATTGAVAARPPTVSPGCSSEAEPAGALARLIYPEPLNRAIAAYTLTHIVTPAYHADPGLQSLEAEHPGIIDAMIVAMRPEFERGRSEALPLLWAKTCAVYAAGLTPEDLEQAISFFKSPAGQRLAAAERDAVALAPRPSGTAAPLARAPTVASEDERARSSFHASVAGRKLDALQARIDAIVSAWIQAPTPEADRRVEDAMSGAAARFYESETEPVRLVPATGPPADRSKPVEQP